MQVANRLVEAGVKGRSVTLKLKRRKEGAPEPYKFLGSVSSQLSCRSTWACR